MGASPRRNGAPRGPAPSVLDPRTGGRDREVLEAAAEVFARKGYAAATVQDVADALGILKGSLYYYIKTKEDLLFRLLDEVHEAADALHVQVAATDGLTAFEQLLLYVRLQVAWNVANLVKISVYYNDLRQLGDARMADLRRRSKAHEEFIVDLITAGQDEGDIVDDVPAALLANQVFAVVIWPYRWYRPRGSVSVDALIAECESFVRGGLKRETADQAPR
jgi:AcrR family transcriptional regulator